MDKTKIFILKKGKKYLKTGLVTVTGRNIFGRITVFTKGRGLNNYKYNYLTYKYNNFGIGYIIKRELNFRRSAFLGLIFFQNGILQYVILPNNLKIFNILHGFDFRLMFENVYIGMWSHLNLFPINSYLYNVELKSFQGGKLARAAGSWVRLIGKNDTKAVIKMKSGLKMILSNTVFGSFGVVSRLHWKLHKFKNAGEKRNLGFKPKVRGVAMNPCDHPHGGGEGKKSKKVTPRTPWGKFTMNTKTKTSLRALKKKSKLKKIEYYL